MNTLTPLLRALHRNGLEPTATELADALWLAGKIAQRTAPGTPFPGLPAMPVAVREAPLAEETAPAPVPENDTLPPQPAPPVAEAEPAATLHSRPPAADSPLLRSPGVPLLPERRALARALRPLHRKVPSRTRFALDETATATQVAEQRLWWPVLRGQTERRDDLVFIVEDSPSLVIWQPLVAALRKLLRQQGFFRDIRTYRLRLPPHSPTPCLFNAQNSRVAPPALRDPRGRRLFLLISDNLNPAWLDPAVARLLQTWPLALLNLLPPRLWAGSALSRFEAVYVPSPRPVPGLHLPVLSLAALGRWADWVSGRRQVYGFVLPLADAPAPEDEPAEQSVVAPDAAARLQRFRAAASPTAWRLALLLSAVPLTLPVMRLVQDKLLPAANLGHLAECLFGGLMQRVSPAPGTWPRQVQADAVGYEFHPGVRARLVAILGEAEVLAVWDVLSAYVREHLGQALDFRAWVGNPDLVEVTEATRAFAAVGVEVLRGLGGVYGELVGRLEAGLQEGAVTSSNRPVVKAVHRLAVACSFRDPLPSGSSGPEMISLENTPLSFKMGSEAGENNEKPVHDVALSPFAIGIYPVTVGEFRQFVESTGYQTQAEREGGAWIWQNNWKKVADANWRNPYQAQTDHHPVVCVSWHDAQAYCKWLSDQTGQDYRLLTEAEWEYTCRAGTDSTWCFGDDEEKLPDYAWYSENANGQTHPVGEKDTYHFNRYDMHGNVWEWCYDWYSEYEQSAVNDPVGPDSGTHRVQRGGSWFDDARLTRSACRSGNMPDDRSGNIGFRLARGQAQQAKRDADAGKAGQAPRSGVGQVLRALRDSNPWAERIEEDEYGIYADFAYQKVVQRMRLILPGRFWIGSPESEPERHNDEHQHAVILTKPFWLADTACTQALWQAVMGYNPSHFKGSENPVETVSWNDVQKFFDTICEIASELRFRLPTEAEWEYACRAGTITPFYFGENITTEFSNYDGNYQYLNGGTGQYRQKTVGVKELPCNAWGLYQMHGNVYEWCQDWFGNYPMNTVTNPAGPNNGTARILRGGSWDGNARGTRSADRGRFIPDRRVSGSGFRFARDQTELGQMDLLLTEWARLDRRLKPRRIMKTLRIKWGVTED